MSYINLALAGTVATLSLHVFTVPVNGQVVNRGCSSQPGTKKECSRIVKTETFQAFLKRWCKTNENPKKDNCQDGSGSGGMTLNLDKEGKGRVKVVVLPGQTLKDVCESAGLDPVPGTTDMCQEKSSD